MLKCLTLICAVQSRRTTGVLDGQHIAVPEMGLGAAQGPEPHCVAAVTGRQARYAVRHRVQVAQNGLMVNALQ